MSNAIRTGADELVVALKDGGVNCVFGVPGSQNLALFDALDRHKLRTVLATSETMAGFMALGWYRASGRPGVFLAMPGPGFTYAIPPLAEAALDSSAVVLITGQPPDRGRIFDLQSVDQESIIKALCKGDYPVEEHLSVRETIKRAINDSNRLGAGPVVVQVARTTLERDIPDGSPIAGPTELEQPEWLIPSDLASLLRNCRKPMFFVGAAALEHAERLHSLGQELNALISATPAARGVVPEDNWRVIPFDLLIDDSDAVNKMMEESDIIIALGCRFSHNGTGGFSMQFPTEKLVHVSPDSSVLDANYRAKWAISVDIGEFLRVAQCTVQDRHTNVVDGWSKTDANRWRKKILQRKVDKNGEPTWLEYNKEHCHKLFCKVRKALPDNGILVTDTGSHQILTRKYFEVRCPRGLIMPTDFQSMGFGLPAAIGAALAAPGRKVVALLGDGGFLMTMPELVTIAREEIPIVIVVVADGWLGQIRMQQIDSGAAEFATRLQMMDISGVAQSAGIRYVRGDGELEVQIRDGLNSDMPLIIEVKIGDPPNLNVRRRRARTKQGAKTLLGHHGVKFVKKFIGRQE